MVEPPRRQPGNLRGPSKRNYTAEHRETARNGPILPSRGVSASVSRTEATATGTRNGLRVHWLANMATSSRFRRKAESRDRKSISRRVLDERFSEETFGDRSRCKDTSTMSRDVQVFTSRLRRFSPSCPRRGLAVVLSGRGLQKGCRALRELSGRCAGALKQKHRRESRLETPCEDCSSTGKLSDRKVR